MTEYSRRLSLGQTSSGDSLPLKVIQDGSVGQLAVVLATFDSATRPAGSVAINSISTTVLAANSSRKYAAITNNGGSVVYLGLGGTAYLDRGIRLNTTGNYEINKLNNYTGIITGIRNAGASVNLCVVEA